ncbi:hypothetical protein [Photobacterium leiognathi]|uniref:hypothetical protein n=1 Tax=Photobacterium leiognathi TaxID=553611 RepID=UPI002980E276|nr:hypothetical protein [Photobacterium leiognathi]
MYKSHKTIDKKLPTGFINKIITKKKQIASLYLSIKNDTKKINTLEKNLMSDEIITLKEIVVNQWPASAIALNGIYRRHDGKLITTCINKMKVDVDENGQISIVFPGVWKSDIKKISDSHCIITQWPPSLKLEHVTWVD